MDGESPASLRPAALARRWLENPCDSLARGREHACGDAFNTVVMPGFRVSVAEPGRLVCSFRVPATVADADGRWHAGAISAAVDNICAAVVYTVDGAHKFTVNHAISFFSPATHGEEVEMDARVAHRKGKLMAAVVEVRRKASGELVAVVRQWMTSTQARSEKSGDSRSKL
ncbi:acyl-coenzyme A thioesterase 13-like [Oryza brachyantha]|uniref:acyl-coenzyme A thioesterase 13-like n=1 Tax=Oryza brachyantha TaxID=4533 RepID=UPI00077675A7|nr:acyl-coenzyme A thioesterase 13-like [Oryza brachyantha]